MNQPFYELCTQFIISIKIYHLNQLSWTYYTAQSCRYSCQCPLSHLLQNPRRKPRFHYLTKNIQFFVKLGSVLWVDVNLKKKPFICLRTCLWVWPKGKTNLNHINVEWIYLLQRQNIVCERSFLTCVEEGVCLFQMHYFTVFKSLSKLLVLL